MPPRGALVPPPQGAKPAHKSARCGVGNRSPRPHPPHPQPVGSAPRPHAPKDGRSGLGERPTPDAPHPGKRRPPLAPSCRPHSAQSQLARARAVGLVTGPHAHNPRTHSQWVVGHTPQRTGGRGWESAAPRTPHTQARGAPPQAPSGRPRSAQSQLARARAVGLVTGPDARGPHHPQPVGRGPRPNALKDGRSGLGERPTPDAPDTGKRRPPRAPSCHPHKAQSQLTRARAVGLVTGPHAHTPRTHSQWVVRHGRTPQRTGGRGWESARPRTPHTQARGAPPPGALVPPPQRANPARKSARHGVGDGSPQPHPLHPQPVGSGPRPHAPKDGPSGVGERPTPAAPHPGEGPPPRAPSCRPHSAQSQHTKGGLPARGARDPKQGKATKGPGHPPTS